MARNLITLLCTITPTVQKLTCLSGAFHYSEQEAAHQKLCHLLTDRHSTRNPPMRNRFPRLLCLRPNSHCTAQTTGFGKETRSPWICYGKSGVGNGVGEVARQILREHGCHM